MDAPIFQQAAHDAAMPAKADPTQLPVRSPELVKYYMNAANMIAVTSLHWKLAAHTRI
jgi:hypothetical protein